MRTPTDRDLIHQLLDELAERIARRVAERVCAAIQRDATGGDEPLLCTVAQAAALLGISRSAAYEEIARSGTLFGAPVLKTSGRMYVSRPALKSMIANGPAGQRRAG
uniref:DNA-binding protein n=2 Tax=Thermorudis TaxID=1649508 RepID=A0A7C2W711_9BACT